MSGTTERPVIYGPYWQAAGLVIALEELGVSVISARTYKALPCRGYSHFIEISKSRILQFHVCGSCQRAGSISVFVGPKKNTLIGFINASILNSHRTHRRRMIAKKIQSNGVWKGNFA